MFVDILILGNLLSRPMHGYEIKRTIESRLGGTIRLTNSQLYPALKSFEEMGAITREVVRQEGKPDRHLYRATPLAHKILHGLITDFDDDKSRRDTEFYARLPYFRFLAPEERLAILGSRRRQIADRAAKVEMWPDTAEPYLRGLKALRQGAFERELDQIDTWIAAERGAMVTKE